MRSLFRALPLLLMSMPLSGAPIGQNAAGTSPPTSAEEIVHISFAGSFGDKPFACGQYYEGVGSNGATVTPSDLRFFVSNVALLAADGTPTPVVLEQDGVWQYRSLALIDLEDGTGGCRNGNAAMHAEISGTVARGNYTGLRFTLGVPFELDHIDDSTAPSPLNMTAMLWSWQNGYKFLRAEVSTRARQARSMAKATGAVGFPVHVGSTGCASTGPNSGPDHECKYPNRTVVTLPAFDATKDTVVFDMSKLLGRTDLSRNTQQTAPGCMSFPSDPDCIGVMQALGLVYGDLPAKPQVVFYAREK